MIAYLYKNDSGLALVVGGGEECLDKLRTLARAGHRMLVWRRGRYYVALQGGVHNVLNEMPFRDVRPSYWNMAFKRVLDGGEGDARSVCNACEIRDECWRGHGGPEGAIPDHRETRERLGWNPTATEELAAASHEDLWNRCGLTRSQDGGCDDTLTAKDLKAVGFQVVDKHRLLDASGAEGDNWILRAMEDKGLTEESPIADLRKATTRFDSFSRGSRWGKEMNFVDIKLDPEIYQINRVKARVRADKGVATKAGNKDFAKRECSRCVYGCESVPWRHSDITRCHVSEDTLISGVTVDAGFLYRHTMAGMKSNVFPLGVAGRLRKGIVYAPDDNGGLEIVSRVYPYKSIGKMNLEDFVRVAGGELQDPETWLANYRSRNPDLKMELVSWALSQMKSVAGRDRSIQWYGSGRGKRNDVLAIQLRDRGEIEVKTDTSQGESNAPRFSFRLVYPYFHSFRTQLARFPGSGRQRW
jgi:hypothetical protein